MPTDSLVLATAPAPAAAMAAAMKHKLKMHTDAWDLAIDLANGVDEIVVVDTRSGEHYRRGHIPGAISVPHLDMSAETLEALDRSSVYVTYCDGVGCNGSTWGAFKLATAGLRVKELLGGLDFWRRDGHPVVTGSEPGSMIDESLTHCGCR